jgi:hypothetical protein
MGRARTTLHLGRLVALDALRIKGRWHMAEDAQLEVVFTTPVETGGHEMYIVLSRLRIGMIHFPALPGYAVSEISALGSTASLLLLSATKPSVSPAFAAKGWFVVLRAFRARGDESIWRFREGLP